MPIKERSRKADVSVETSRDAAGAAMLEQEHAYFEEMRKYWRAIRSGDIDEQIRHLFRTVPGPPHELLKSVSNGLIMAFFSSRKHLGHEARLAALLALSDASLETFLSVHRTLCEGDLRASWSAARMEAQRERPTLTLDMNKLLIDLIFRTNAISVGLKEWIAARTPREIEEMTASKELLSDDETPIYRPPVGSQIPCPVCKMLDSLPGTLEHIKAAHHWWTPEQIAFFGESMEFAYPEICAVSLAPGVVSCEGMRAKR